MKIKLKELRDIIRREIRLLEMRKNVDGDAGEALRKIIREMILLEVGKVPLKPPPPESKPAFIKLLSWASSRIPGSESEYKKAIEAIEKNDYTPALELLRDAFMMMKLPATIAA